MKSKKNGADVKDAQALMRHSKSPGFFDRGFRERNCEWP
jgi:hypothetical protein